MKITPGIRLSLIMHGLEDGSIEVLCIVGKGSLEKLASRNVVPDTLAAARVAREFLDARMDAAAPPKTTGPTPDDLF